MKRILEVACGSILCLLLVASCSTDVAKLASPAPGGPEAATPAGQVTAMRVGPGGVAVRTSTTRVSRWISPEYGGIISNGRFTVWFPAASVSKVTFVSIKTVKPTGMLECEIYPSDLVLSAQAALIIDVSGFQSTSTRPNTIFWYDGGTQSWVDLGTIGPARGSLLETRISHLGRFMVGRTGR